MKINVYCRNLGWLFEDLKQEIARHGAIASELPLPNMDRYICIRTNELSLSPKPDKTLVQIHDLTYADVSRAGVVSFCHPSQVALWMREGLNTNYFHLPIGSRDVEVSKLPERPTLGFFCREVKGSKGSILLQRAVDSAKKLIDFDVLMIGKNLDHIAHLGRYEPRAAEPEDYNRITAFMTLNPTMVAISAYESLAAGRAVISTPRDWVYDFVNLYVGRTPEELSRCIVNAMKKNMMVEQKPFSRSDWAARQIQEAINL